jgi:tetratricopeptide (TPR) repeat protein
VGDVLGEANCIQSLGDIALVRSNHQEARERYQEALPLYRRVGAVLGEANCIQSLGDIALAEALPAAAEKLWREALKLFETIPEHYSIGWTLRRLARLAASPDTRHPILTSAVAAWSSIDRPDLVEDLRREFSNEV